MSSQQLLKNQIIRATDLEAQLAALPPKASEEKASRIRIQLCEVLSDVILTDPQFALRKDCTGRLWRNCFYARIGELRSRIAREKRKKGEATKLDLSLKVFLKEAIALYKYFVDNYETKLLPPLQSSQEEDSQQVSIANTKAQEGVVPGLHRILIHLGDLYRYSTNYSLAEKAYDRASKLAPGKGNPYNQLAVVAQLKDPSAPLSCMALFFYARALLASHDPFETSKANLARLLETNRAYLQTTSEDALLAATNKTGPERVRAQKTIQSRLFLARFVDLHYDFFRGKEDCRKSITEEELVDKMQVILTEFESLLKEWAFGDALLSKMVAINAFSIKWASKSNGDVALARAFLLQFGAVLTERLELGLRKTSVRLLLPLIILCDYVSTWDEPSKNAVLGKQASQFCADAFKMYWNKITGVATHLSPLRDSSDLQVATCFVSTGMRLKEYDSLVGFSPFDSFVKPSDVYVSVDEAIRVLELRISTPTQELTGLEENAIKLKRFFEIVDAMVEKDHLSCAAGGQDLVGLAEIEDDGIVDDDNAMMDDDEILESENAKPVEKSSDVLDRTTLPRPSPKEGPTLVYKPSESGAGPALLVPGALLLSTSQEAPPTDEQDKHGSAFTSSEELLKECRQDPLENLLFSRTVATTDSVSNVLLEERPAAAPPAQLGPPPGILPPPGFGVGAAPGFSVPAPQPTPMAGFDLYPSFTPPPPRQSSLLSGIPNYSQTPPGFSHADTVLQMLRGSTVNTANPFLMPPTQGAAAPGLFPSQSSFSEFVDHDMDGEFLLDSSLLNSMLMDENNSQPRSKNPFLT
jgi:tetratricopeptide (TPR) repeat protein